MSRPRVQTGRAVVDFVIAAIILTAVVEAQSLPRQARLVPTVVGIATLVFLVSSILVEVFPKRLGFLKPRTPRSDETNLAQAEQPADWGSTLKVISYVLSFWVLVFFFGFYAVPPVLVASYLVFEGRLRWFVAVSLSLVATGLTLLGLAVLGVQPWIGAAPELIEGYVGGAVMPLF